MKKRIFSMLIAVCMVFTMLPSTAFATGVTPIGASDVDSGKPPVNAPSEAQKRGETPCTDEAEGLLYLDEIAPQSTVLTAEQQAFLDAHLAICEVCDTIMNPPLMNLSTVIDVPDITGLNGVLRIPENTEIRLTANIIIPLT